ncbi:hypothetical protein N0V90_002951 [Kalmusia sp. IMI 367209]|nr:hypothetical protein N0V90_002951 [Kalmusia sp. IMI 367209]
MNATLIRSSILGAILERTPLLTHLTYDCWIDCFDLGRQRFGATPFSLSSLTTALQSVKGTLKSLNVSVTPFYNDRKKDLHMLRWIEGSLGSLKGFVELEELAVKPWELLYDEQEISSPLMDLLPPSLQILRMKCGIGRVVKDSPVPPFRPSTYRADKLLSFVAAFTPNWKHYTPELREFEIDAQDCAGVWVAQHTEAVRDLIKKTGIDCKIVEASSRTE